MDSDYVVQQSVRDSRLGYDECLSIGLINISSYSISYIEEFDDMSIHGCPNDLKNARFCYTVSGTSSDSTGIQTIILSGLSNSH